MDEKKRKRFVYIALGGALLFAFAYFGGGDKKSITTTADTSQSPTIQPLTSQPIVIDYDKFETMIWGNDPFIRGNIAPSEIYEDTTNTEYRLSGILLGDGPPSAIINYKIVSPGEIIDGARIINIYKNKVVLQKHDGLKINLSLIEEKS